MNIVLGIDPGLGKTGYALIDTQSMEIMDCGIIATSAQDTMAMRLRTIREDLQELLVGYREYQIAHIGLEMLFFTRNITTAIHVAQARGIILEICAEYRIIELSPTQIKQIITGNSKAKKADMQESIKQLFSLTKRIQPDDANDAIAIAVASSRLCL